MLSDSSELHTDVLTVQCEVQSTPPPPNSKIWALLNNFSLLIRLKIWTALKSSEVYHSNKSASSPPPLPPSTRIFIPLSSCLLTSPSSPGFFFRLFPPVFPDDLLPLLHSPVFLGLTLTDGAALHWSSLIKWIAGRPALWLSCGLLWDPVCSLHYRGRRRDICYCCYSAAM